jgi:hypothetical protein
LSGKRERFKYDYRLIEWIHNTKLSVINLKHTVHNPYCITAHSHFTQIIYGHCLARDRPSEWCNR